MQLERVQTSEAERDYANTYRTATSERSEHLKKGTHKALGIRPTNVLVFKNHTLYTTVLQDKPIEGNHQRSSVKGNASKRWIVRMGHKRRRKYWPR